MAQAQLAGRMAAFQLYPALAVGVVEQQLVVTGHAARLAELLAANSPLRAGIAVRRAGACGAMPQGTVAARQITLPRYGVIVGRMENTSVVLIARNTARRGYGAALALPVVQRADDDGPVDIVFQELHQHFLADARQELAAHAAAGRALRHAHPASRASLLLPVEADAHPAQPVAINFIGAAGHVIAIGADDDGALAAQGGRRGVLARIVAVMHRTPRGACGDHLDAVGVTAGLRLGDRGGDIGKSCAPLRHGFFQQFRYRAEQFRQSLQGRRRQVVDADAGHAQHDIFGRGTIGLR
ncbi:hypothetical protein JALI103349_26470 [Janthinobacterium lividum]